MKKVVVVKIGGGSITDKSSPVPLLLKDKLFEVAHALSLAAKTFSIVLVVGAGSFGHGKARAAGFSSMHGVDAREVQVRLNACDVREQVLELCLLLQKELRILDVPCFRLTPPSWNERTVSQVIIPEGLSLFVFCIMV